MYWEGLQNLCDLRSLPDCDAVMMRRLQNLCDTPEPQGDNTHVISVSHPNGSNPSPMQLSRIDTNGRQWPDFRPSCATLWPVPGPKDEKRSHKH